MSNEQQATEAELYWACPACGSRDIEGLAWICLNGEAVVSYDEGADHWCPDCEEHYRSVCHVGRDGHCLIHDQNVSECRSRTGRSTLPEPGPRPRAIHDESS